jgi:ABC-type branched-subunit amino acid transport system permease subunit
MTIAPLDKPMQVGKAGLSHTAVFWIGFCVVMAVLIAAPLVLPEFWRRFLTEILIWGLLAMSSDLLIGYTGMVSFGHSAFFGLGMYGAAAARGGPHSCQTSESLARDHAWTRGCRRRSAFRSVFLNPAA